MNLVDNKCNDDKLTCNTTKVICFGAFQNPSDRYYMHN